MNNPIAINPLGIDPVIFTVPAFDLGFAVLGPFGVRYYGLMYVIGFLIGSYIMQKMIEKKFFPLSKKDGENFVTFLIIGMFIGARTFYVFIYNWDQYKNDLGEIFNIMGGGLSFHGAIAGMCVVCFLVARKYKKHFLQITDTLAVGGSIGLFFGRLGNFMNGELYGRITDSAFGMMFRHGGPYPRHPSQLYEAFSEGLLLFIILWFTHKKQPHHGYVSAFFMIGYGFFRYCVEFFREADSQLGYYFGGTTTMGQILCMIMMLIGVGIFFYVRKKQIPMEVIK